jgi:hypothetical protein
VRAQRVAGATAAVGLTRCSDALDPSLNRARCGSASIAPTAPQSPRISSRPVEIGGCSITAGQAITTAVARLQLPTVAPGIGPSPDLPCGSGPTGLSHTDPPLHWVAAPSLSATQWHCRPRIARAMLYVLGTQGMRRARATKEGMRHGVSSSTE